MSEQPSAIQQPDAAASEKLREGAMNDDRFASFEFAHRLVHDAERWQAYAEAGDEFAVWLSERLKLGGMTDWAFMRGNLEANFSHAEAETRRADANQGKADAWDWTEQKAKEVHAYLRAYRMPESWGKNIWHALFDEVLDLRNQVATATLSHDSLVESLKAETKRADEAEAASERLVVAFQDAQKQLAEANASLHHMHERVLPLLEGETDKVKAIQILCKAGRDELIRAENAEARIEQLEQAIKTIIYEMREPHSEGKGMHNWINPLEAALTRRDRETKQ